MISLPLRAGSLLLGGAAVGLGLSPVVGLGLALPSAAVTGAAFTLALFIGHLRSLRQFRTLVGMALVAFALALGLILGNLRLAAIDAGAFRAAVGENVEIAGFLVAPPGSAGSDIRLHLSSAKGRVAVLTDRLPGRLPVGAGLRIRGSAEGPPDYLRQYLDREGIVQVIRAESLERAPPRAGLWGLLDGIRERAVAAMGAGMPEREAALAAGFVLGQDADIDSTTEENFRRAGLAHLVAASGQNVMLLILLGTLPLAVAGLHLRRRMPLLILLVAIYVPLAGAGPSIQRAAVMGIVMLAMVWLGGVGPRLLGLLAAAAFTLLLNPRASADVGWQLSFAATLGIMLLAPGLRDLILDVARGLPRRDGSGRVTTARAGSLPRLLAEGASVTVAATLATAPLIAHHFGSLPLASIAANLLAMPAVAAVMWLGMIAAFVGQAPALPTEAINWINAILIAYIAEIAAAVSGLPGGIASFELGPGGLVAAAEALVLGGAWALLRWLRRSVASHRLTGAFAGAALSLAVVIPLAAMLVPTGWFSGSARPPTGLRIVALDVGQGDAILVQVRNRSLLIDTGPPGAGLSRSLQRYGVKRLEAVLITHADLDHIGGFKEVAERFPIGTVMHEAPLAVTAPSFRRIAAGHTLRLGEAEIDVLWPPAAYLSSGERNARSLVLLLRWRGFKALFTGDAEAEAAGYRPGDIDLLKVAHHGSADRGLPALLAESTPRWALISAGRDNRHGHPHPTTLAALRAASVSVLRTDRDGDLVLDLP